VKEQKVMRMVEATAVSLFFVQAVRVLFSVLFGVIYDAIFTGPMTLGAVVINLLVLLAFLAPLFAPRRRGRSVLLAASALIFLARIPLTLNDPQIRLYSSCSSLRAAASTLPLSCARIPTPLPGL